MLSRRAPPEKPRGKEPTGGLQSQGLLLVGSAAFIICIIVALVGMAILQSKSDALRAAESVSDNLSITLADNFDSTVRQIELGLLTIRDEVSKQQNADRPDEEALKNLISRQEARIPNLVGFRLFGPDGRMRVAINNVVNPGADISKRPDFQFLRDSPDSGLMVSAPLVGVVSTEWLISLAHRITLADGSFGGVVYGAIPIPALTKEFSRVNLGSHGIAVLYHANYTLAARYPVLEGPDNPIGTTIISDKLRAIIASGAEFSRLEYHSPINGNHGTATVRKIKGYPYFIMVGIAEEDYLADWQRTRAGLLFFGTVMLGIVVVGALLLHRRIAERERLDRSFEREHLRLKAILKTASDGIHILDSNGVLIEANDAFLNMLGYDDTVVGKIQVTDWDTSDTWAEIKERNDDLVARHASAVFETRHRRRDGRVFDVEINASGIEIDGQGYLYAASRDISDRKLFEKRMQESEERYRTTFHQAPVGIINTSFDGRFLQCNARYAEIIGYSQEEVLRLTYQQITVPDDLDDSQELVRRLVTGEIPIARWEKRYIRKDGAIIWVRLTVTPLRDRDGRLVHLITVVEDINERKMAERQQQIAATAFETQEGMVVTDADGVILRVNRAFSEITGYSEEDAVGKKTNILKSGRHEASFYAEMWRILRQQGAWKGEIWNRRKNGEVYPEWLTITAVKDGAGATTHYVSTMTDITLRKSAEDEIRHLAFYDPLTRLPNRRLLIDRLRQALASSGRSGREGALLFIDLDNFKTLNDTLGHNAGDLLLQQVGERLATCVREGDTVARLGGDEFLLMLEDLSANSQEAAMQVENVGKKILAILSQPYQIAGQNVRSTPSIGATLFNDHRSSIDELLKRADLAMYEAKGAGRNTLRFFDPIMQATVEARAGIEADLRHGMEKGQFMLHYQAQVTEGGGVTGAEALVRWQHPERGLVSPAEFISIAEETGLILPLGRWVLETACTHLAAWANQPVMARLTLAVNVSARQFHQNDFVDGVLEVLDKTGADPHKLKLELTESLFLENIEDVISKINALRFKGVSFSLDDFGTGYSSLSYLKRLPLDQLKIDQSFVRDVLSDANAAAIVLTIVTLGNSLDLSVIAEGVETKEECDLLVGQGCHAYQGFLFSRPLPLDGFEQLVLNSQGGIVSCPEVL